MANRSELDRNGQLADAKALAAAGFAVDGHDGKTGFLTQAVAQFGLLGADELVQIWNQASGTDPKTMVPVDQEEVK